MHSSKDEVFVWKLNCKYFYSFFIFYKQLQNMCHNSEIDLQWTAINILLYYKMSFIWNNPLLQ